MYYLNVLNQTVAANLDNDRIGAPVFVRWTASIAQSKDVLRAQLVEMTVHTVHWLATDVRRLYATGTESQGHLSLALETAAGSSALLALTLAHDRPHVNLAIYGNHGAIYHSEFIAPVRDGAVALQAAGGTGEDTLDLDARLLLDAIEQSLALHRPIELIQSGGRL